MVRNSSDLQKLIPASCLPSEYGGSLKSMKELCCHWRKYLMENQEFFRKLERNVPIGPIPKEFTPDDNEFGVDGSFRKLSID